LRHVETLLGNDNATLWRQKNGTEKALELTIYQLSEISGDLPLDFLPVWD
jgi:hypothetical protein